METDTYVHPCAICGAPAPSNFRILADAVEGSVGPAYAWVFLCPTHSPAAPPFEVVGRYVYTDYS